MLLYAKCCGNFLYTKRFLGGSEVGGTVWWLTGQDQIYACHFLVLRYLMFHFLTLSCKADNNTSVLSFVMIPVASKVNVKKWVGFHSFKQGFPLWSHSELFLIQSLHILCFIFYHWSKAERNILSKIGKFLSSFHFVIIWKSLPAE